MIELLGKNDISPWNILTGWKDEGKADMRRYQNEDAPQGWEHN